MRTALACVLALLVVAAVGAQDQEKKTEPPKGTPPTSRTFKAPEGWRFHKSKDGSYSVLFPNEREGLAHSERSFNSKGFVGKQQVMQCSLKDGRDLLVIGTALGGPATKDMKIGDVYDLMYELDMGPGVKLSEPQEIQVGVRKGKEYFVIKKKEAERNVVVVVRGRVYQLVVTAKDKKATQDKTADIFLTSLLLHAPQKKEPDKKADQEKKGGQ
jgi:hypothetical protein